MESSVRLLENIKPSVNIDDALFEGKESTPTNEHRQYSFTVELPRAVSPSRKVIFFGPPPNNSGGVKTAHMAYQDPNYCVSTIVKKRNSYTASGKIHLLTY